MIKQSLAMAIIALCIILPKFAFAATASFGQKQFDLPVSFAASINSSFVRNDFQLIKIAESSLTGFEDLNYEALLSEETLAKVLETQAVVDQKAHDAKLVLENNKATEFDPGQSGQTLDLYQLRSQLALNTISFELPVIISSPQKRLDQTNNLGINELVATGESNFTGSPNNRIHNIAVGASKFNGLVIAPGEEFSFNRYLGDVDGEHGFLPELVIKPEGVTPEFGGGLCQVSSTAFRAAMNAGLTITARRNHSFAVQYYAPQGTDATIYPGSADLKFVNNLKSPMLIATRIEGKKLYFDFYGTKDDRIITFEGPIQYDKKPNGSMKASWTRHVTLNGQTTDQVFKSVYLPPALFHHDAVEQTSTPNPQTPPPPAPVPAN